MKTWLTYCLWSMVILITSILLIRYYIDWDEIALWVGSIVGLIAIPLFILLDYFFIRRKVRPLILLGVLRGVVGILLIQCIYFIADALK
ncbi:hypothetical protein [Spongiimicrobium salis]|uniref:hypothetical protein n=1 Tax=Spongiimicrobium salis TaxID=1667022 RepID=UPI00374D1E14